jgi:hypothetical protein
MSPGFHMKLTSTPLKRHSLAEFLPQLFHP